MDWLVHYCHWYDGPNQLVISRKKGHLQSYAWLGTGYLHLLYSGGVSTVFSCMGRFRREMLYNGTMQMICIAEEKEPSHSEPKWHTKIKTYLEAFGLFCWCVYITVRRCECNMSRPHWGSLYEEAWASWLWSHGGMSLRMSNARWPTTPVFNQVATLCWSLCYSIAVLVGIQARAIAFLGLFTHAAVTWPYSVVYLRACLHHYWTTAGSPTVKHGMNAPYKWKKCSCLREVPEVYQ